MQPPVRQEKKKFVPQKVKQSNLHQPEPVSEVFALVSQNSDENMNNTEETKGEPKVNSSMQSQAPNRLVNAMSSGLSGLFNRNAISQHMESNLLEPKKNDNRFDQGARTFINRTSQFGS